MALIDGFHHLEFVVKASWQIIAQGYGRWLEIAIGKVRRHCPGPRNAKMALVSQQEGESLDQAFWHNLSTTC
jgi:hypothetical protein